MRVCTGFGPAGYAEYGVRALESFNQFWPKSVELIAYTEDQIPMPRGECRSLWDIPGAREFVERHKDNLAVQGRAPCEKWGDKEKRRFATKPGTFYTYRFDALKFFRQCLIPEHASLGMNNDDILVWLDGDVISTAYIPEDFVEQLLRPKNRDYDICYLGRRKHRDRDPDNLQGDSSEIGFWAVRLNAKTREFLRRFAGAWREDTFMRYAEWHSAYVFDCTRHETARLVRMTMRDLTPGGSGHVWHTHPASPLRAYMDHLKGDRKSMERSPEARKR